MGIFILNNGFDGHVFYDERARETKDGQEMQISEKRV
jgi:hypothetical protein